MNSAALNLACPDWFDRLKSGLPPMADLVLNDNFAEKSEAIFNKLVLPDVVGQPTMAEAAGQWIKAIVRNIFGTLKPDLTRDIREFLLLVPKKNAKTTNGAGIMITALLMNKRPRAEFILIGPTQEISDTAFSQAVGMIEGDPDGYLQKRFKIVEHKKTIIDMNPESPGYKAKLRIKTFDTKVVTGVKPAGILVDELHVLGKNKDASKVMKQLRGGIIANPEAFLIFITTQSDEPPTGVFKTELDYARQIRDGEIKGDMLPILYEFPVKFQADEKEPWKNPELWHLVLPNLNLSIDLERLVGEFEKAVNKGVEELSEWASQHLNIQIGIAMSKDRWRGVEHWLAAADPTITLETLMERCEVLVVGIDGGGLDDIFGLTVIGREIRDHDDGVVDEHAQRWLSWSKGWIHPEAMEQRKQSQEKYRQFAKEGDLTICEYPNQDAIEAAEICEKIKHQGLFPEKYAIGVDAVGISDFIDELQAREFQDDEYTAVAQGYRLSGSINGAERRLKAQTLIHDGSNMMTWVVGNAKAEMRGNAVLITKQVSGRAKIDPLIATFNAYALMSRHPVASQAAMSPWEDPNFTLEAA